MTRFRWDRQRRERLEDVVGDPMRVVQARFPSKCPACGGHIKPGNKVARNVSTAKWVHVRCREVV
jgi:hypothetical protein